MTISQVPVMPWIDPAARPMAFPPVEQAWSVGSPAPGLLALGGDLSVERLLLAYSEGIFPWSSQGEPLLWWSLDPRMVLYSKGFKFSRSLRKSLQRFLTTPSCEVRVDSAFSAVMTACSSVKRAGQDGTWIFPEMVQAYTQLHRAGFAHSFETWENGELVGGLYGVSLGRMFYGESMFSHQTDASKLALCGLVAFARVNDMPLIDCQQHTAHLSFLGGCTIPRAQFIQEMKLAQQQPSPGWFEGVMPGEYWSALLS